MTRSRLYGASHTDETFDTFLDALATVPDHTVTIFETAAQVPSDLVPTPAWLLHVLANAVAEEWGLDHDPTAGAQGDEETVRLANELTAAFRSFVDRSGAVRGLETLRSWSATRTADGFTVTEQ